MEKDHLSAIGLDLGVLTGETQFKGKSEAKKGALHAHAREKKLAAPFQAIQVILMPSQVHFKCSSCP